MKRIVISTYITLFIGLFFYSNNSLAFYEESSIIGKWQIESDPLQVWDFSSYGKLVISYNNSEIKNDNYNYLISKTSKCLPSDVLDSKSRFLILTVPQKPNLTECFYIVDISISYLSLIDSNSGKLIILKKIS